MPWLRSPEPLPARTGLTCILSRGHYTPRLLTISSGGAAPTMDVTGPALCPETALAMPRMQGFCFSLVSFGLGGGGVGICMQGLGTELLPQTFNLEPVAKFLGCRGRLPSRLTLPAQRNCRCKPTQPLARACPNLHTRGPVVLYKQNPYAVT